MVQFSVNFLGTTVVDRRFSRPMVPWIIADIARRRKTQKIDLIVDNGEIVGKCEDVVLFSHQIHNLQTYCREPNNVRTFMYLMKDDHEPVLNVYLFQASEFEVIDILYALGDSMKEKQMVTKSHGSASNLTTLCPDISPTNSQFFEVFYVGKMKVSHGKVPDTFVDDALERIRLYELEKSKKQVAETQQLQGKAPAGKLGERNGDSSDGPVNRGNQNGEIEEQKGSGKIVSTSHPQQKDKNGYIEDHDKENVNAAFSGIDKIKLGTQSGTSQADKRYMRTRTGSLGVIETYKKKVDGLNQNRTMLFYVGKTDLRLISPDRKKVLLHKMLSEINSCTQGMEYNQHFGIVSREADNYVGYIFKCESNSVADNLVSAISQSFLAVKDVKNRAKPSVLSCEHCPMVWFQKLCADVEGLSETKTKLMILKKIETLPEHEQVDIHTKFFGAEPTDIKEQNEILMTLLRTHCERKQSRHVHDSEETRSEFLNQVLGGNTIFMKAKRSLTNSFDHLLKRKGSQTDVLQCKESSIRRSDFPIGECDCSDEYHRSYMTVGSSDGEIVKKEISRHINNKRQNYKRSNSMISDQEKNNGLPVTPDGSVNGKGRRRNGRSSSQEFEDETNYSKTPLMNIFLKVGSASKTSPVESSPPEELARTPSGSWRQAIFNRVVTPGKTEGKHTKKKTKEELRQLWKTAINQQILLIRMEKENARLRASQEEATVKRIKLEYEELGSSTKDNMGIWDLICSKDNRISSKCDNEVLIQAVRQGVPRSKRGDVWYFFALQFCLKHSPFDSSAFPNYDVPYEDLLKQLTSCQHTILIDLGRTFPNHPYFSSPLGPGQLALFNLLKAYSLLDPQVGYCQGLSFVAGILLLHMSEDMAFLLLRHLMFRKGLRNQYLPDMIALQVQLYQLSRLIHDSLPQLYVHFDKNEIAPTLYAASWMLTLFASQFPLGFVTRVFDLLFVERTTEILFRVIMALLEEHNDAILKLSSFEDIMDYLKVDVPKMDSACVDRIMKKVLFMDISKQLHEFEVEYHVLQEEISAPRPELDRLRKTDAENKRLKNQNLSLLEQLEVAGKNISRLEKLRSDQQDSICALETRIKNLEATVRFLGDFITEMSEKHRDLEMAGDFRRIIANIESDTKSRRRSFEKSAFFKKIHSSLDFQDKSNFAESYSTGDLPNGCKFGDAAKNNDAVLRGVPLRVIADDDDDMERKRYQQYSPNLTSKITSGVTSFFNSTTNNQSGKNPKAIHTNSTAPHADVGDFQTKSEKTSGNPFNEMDFLNTKESAICPQNKERLTQSNESNTSIDRDVTREPPIEQSSLAVAESNHLHPLESTDGVHITFNGTTKLKSLKFGHPVGKGNAIDVMPMTKVLHISEDGNF